MERQTVHTKSTEAPGPSAAHSWQGLGSWGAALVTESEADVTGLQEPTEHGTEHTVTARKGGCSGNRSPEEGQLNPAGKESEGSWGR